jgi:gliding motility-associated-like protein
MKLSAQGSLSSGLVLYLPFNGNTLDMSVNSNHAINYGATLASDASGRANCAYSFNGATDYMKILNSASLQIDTNISLCVRVKVNGFFRGTCFGNSIIKKGDADFRSGSYGLRFSSPSAGCSFFDATTQNYIGFFNTSYPFGIANTLPYIDTNNWDCLVFTYNGILAKMYVNGVLRHQYSSSTLIGKNFEDVFLGKMDNVTYPYLFKGVMDDVRIYKRALSASEVSDYCGFVAATNTIKANFKDSSNSCLFKQFTDLSTVSSTAIKLWFWDFGDGGKSALKNPSHLYGSAGTYNVRLVVVDSNGFSDSITKSIVVGMYEFADAGKDTVICKSSSGTPILLSGGGGLYYNWSPTTGLSNPSIANPIATIISPISYILTVIDSLGCMDLDTVNIYWDQGFADAGNDTNVCFVDGKATVNLNASGGIDYLWTPSIGLSNPTINNPVATIFNSAKYFVQVTNSLGCIEVDSITIGHKGRFAKVLNDTSICLENGTAVIGLFSSGGLSYSWFPTTGLSDAFIHNPIATIYGSTEYVVTVKDALGCEDKDTVAISVKGSGIEVNASPKNIQGCVGEEIQLTVTGAKYYKWFPSAGLDKDNVAKPKLTLVNSLIYYVVGTDSLGCVDRDSISVIAFRNPILKLTSDNTKADCTEKSVLLSATGALNYSWTPAIYCETSNLATTKVRPPATTVFTVKGIDENGCIGEDTITVFYEGKSTVKVPNAFTPNNDGINDKIRPIIVCDFEMTEFSIYTRWGYNVFTSYNINTAWDGNSDGKPCDMNTYYYYLKGKNSKGEDILFKGDITLLR